MYFPDQALLPFIKAVDDKVKQEANSKGVREHTASIVKVVSEHVKSDSTLKDKFERYLLSKFDSLYDKSEAVNSVYTEFLRKLVNTRLAEFLDSYRQIQLSKTGSATLSGQNLRDTLLGQHINMKSQISET